MSVTGKQLTSTLASNGSLTLELTDKAFPDPSGNQVLVRMEAAPINPSDLALISAGADLAGAEYSPGKMVAQLSPAASTAQSGRYGMALTLGNEGAGTVIATGDGDDAAKALAGKRVACVPGHAYGEYALADAAMCLPLGDHSAEEGAASFVNPMTALGFVETARRDGQKAIIHTVAASNLGQMLNRICQEDDIALVNIVRRQEHVNMLKAQGAVHVVNSSADDYFDQLCAAIDTTSAFYGFDPIGGGQTADTCFRAMEKVATGRMTEYSRYGSDQQKTMYIYGRLDPSPTLLTHQYGFGWKLATWLLTPFLQSAGTETMVAMRKRVLAGLTTTFASSYKRKVSLEEMLTKEAITDYSAMATGEKYLVTP